MIYITYNKYIEMVMTGGWFMKLFYPHNSTRTPKRIEQLEDWLENLWITQSIPSWNIFANKRMAMLLSAKRHNGYIF